MNLLALSDHLIIAGSAMCVGLGTQNWLLGLGAWLGMVALYRPSREASKSKREVPWTYLDITAAVEQQLIQVVESSRRMKPDMAKELLGGHAQGIVNGWLAITGDAATDDDRERLTGLALSIGGFGER